MERRERESNSKKRAKGARQLTLDNYKKHSAKGMPLGNLTSQFFANIYLNELDQFVKHRLKAKFYIRYVDDFVILHKSKEQLEIWKKEISSFLRKKLKLELHKDKSKIINLSYGVDFVGFRNFYHFKLLKKRNLRKIFSKIIIFENSELTKREIMEIFQGWNAYAKWGNTYELRRSVLKKISSKIKKPLKRNLNELIVSNFLLKKF